MRKYIYIGLGGFLGAAMRLLFREIRLFEWHDAIPLDTLLLNIAGAFVLAFILTVSFEFRELDADIRLGISTGMIGAFTTFSALCKETVRLMNGGRYFYAASYILLSAALGLGAVWLGTAAARGLGKKWIALKKRRMK